jgi:hypothetical protein
MKLLAITEQFEVGFTQYVLRRVQTKLPKRENTNDIKAKVIAQNVKIAWFSLCI